MSAEPPGAIGYCWATRSWLGVDGIWQFLAHTLWSVRTLKVEHDDAANDQTEPDDLDRIPGLPEPEGSDESDRSGTDTGPDGVRGRHGQPLDDQGQQPDRRRIAGDDESAPDRVAESLGARQRSGLSP